MAKSNDTAKLLMTLVTALTGVGGSWYKMEQRVTKLEQELAELRFKWKIDSLKNTSK